MLLSLKNLCLYLLTFLFEVKTERTTVESSRLDPKIKIDLLPTERSNKIHFNKTTISVGRKKRKSQRKGQGKRVSEVKVSKKKII